MSQAHAAQWPNGAKEPANPTQGGRKAIIAAASANLAIAVTKAIAWALTGASSMLAEAIHSVADTANQVVLMVGGKESHKEADEDHPFGYETARYLSGFVVAIVIFTLGGHRDELLDSQWWWVPLAVVMISLCAEGASLRTALKESSQDREGMTILQYIRKAKAPELPVVMLEDSAAVLGLIFAFLGVGLTLLTHNPIFDGIGSACIGILLVVVARVLSREMKSLLEGESATPESRKAVHDALIHSDGVDSVIYMKTVHLGPETILVAAKIAVDPTDSAFEVARIIDNAEASVRAAEPLVGPLFLEPDIRYGDKRIKDGEERPEDQS
ncbi:cation diffusion facilitator family transporter [Cutibacterium acnes]|uniref:cation diffusion facilitator family transporter n=1 Tax=Cutibacterium acnes TaxID=1747 RepID=UPI000219CC8C|nr:cation transporter [Cutibacterium acnes]AEE72902.1 cation diffusion facilitator family transporter [Cutibacterium acnes 266]AID36287.1 cation diffusion facilitator family transporter [Cutibacterium acnes hdn-1]